MHLRLCLCSEVFTSEFSLLLFHGISLCILHRYYPASANISYFTELRAFQMAGYLVHQQSSLNNINTVRELPDVKLEHSPEPIPATAPSSNSIILSSTPSWKQCSHLDLAKQVAILESAVKTGEEFLEKFETSLVMQSKYLRAVSKWIERISKF